jgi:lactobin A/cerein 7B family class IIb bacteriocin
MVRRVGIKSTKEKSLEEHRLMAMPAKQTNAVELSDADLERVAGGVTPGAVVISASISVVVGSAAASAVVTALYDEKIGW